MNQLNEYGSGPGFYRTANSKSYAAIREFVRMHRKIGTPAEFALWNRLRGKKLGGYKFRRQHIIGFFIADFINLAHRLIIEIDGLMHQLPANKKSDQERTILLNVMGFRVIRFANEEVLNNIEKVLSEIVNVIENSAI